MATPGLAFIQAQLKEGERLRRGSDYAKVKDYMDSHLSLRISTFHEV
jgi:hypothetical protein